MGKKIKILKIKIPKSMNLYFAKQLKLYLAKQLKKIPGLKINNINTKRLTSMICQYPRTQSINMWAKTNRKSGIAAVKHYLKEHFPSYISDNESYSPETSTEPSSSQNHADCSPSTSNSLVAPSPTIDDIREEEALVPVVTLSTNPCNDIKRSMNTLLEAYCTYRTDNSQSLYQFLEELVVLHIHQNEVSMHKHIIRAFSDIMREIFNDSFRLEQEHGNGDDVTTGRKSESDARLVLLSKFGHICSGNGTVFR